MDKLESVNRSVWKVIEKRVAVVKFIGNKGIGEKYSELVSSEDRIRQN